MYLKISLTSRMYSALLLKKTFNLSQTRVAMCNIHTKGKGSWSFHVAQ